MTAGQDVTVERLQRALLTAAYVVARHGAAYAPILDRLEHELEERSANDPVRRARAILRAQTVVLKDVAN